MSDWAVQLAKFIKQGKNPAAETIVIGTVKRAYPLKVMIFDGQASLTEEDLIYTAVAKGRYLEAGDEIILIPLADMSKFVFIDKEG